MEGYFWGGSEELWSRAALRLAQSRVTVGANVTHTAKTPPRLEELIDAGCQVTWRRDPENNPLFHRIRRKLKGDGVYQWLDTFQPDFAVISQGGNWDGYEWMRECTRRGVPFVTIAQAATETFWPRLELSCAIVSAYEAAQACFFVSERNVALTRRQLVQPFPRARVVRNPFNVSYDAAPPWPSTDGVWRLACVGRLEPHFKGQDILFDVLGRDTWRRRPIEVTLFGSGPNTESLLALKKMMRLENVTYGGVAEDIEAVWASHHALVLPSRIEGLPLVIVEAMLCGRPCIVTDVAGNAELVQDNVSGFVAAAAAPDCLDEAMERAWQRRDEWRQMGQAAARRVREMVPRDPIGAFLEQLRPLLPTTIATKITTGMTQ